MPSNPNTLLKHLLALLITGSAVSMGTLAWSSTASAAPDPNSVSIDIAASANPSPLGQDVTYTVTLVTPDAGPLDPADTVDVVDDGNYIDCNGLSPSPTATPGMYTVTCDESTSTLNVGDRSITATFNGDPNYNFGVSTQTSITETISPATTITTITWPSPGSSISYGNEGNNSINVSVVAPGVTNQSPSNSVDIYSGTPGPDTYLCTAYVGGSGNGQSTGNCWINSTTLQSGSYTLEGVYSGDNNFAASDSTPQALTISMVTSQMESFAVPGYTFYGAENGNFFIVGVGGGSNGNPTGDATVTAGGVSLLAPGTCSLGNGGGNPCYIDSATALPASTTPYTVTARYAGDNNFTPASVTTTLLVLPATTTTVLTVTPSSASSNDEGSPSISATVTSGTTGAPSGSIAVQRGGSLVCTITHLEPVGTNAATGTCPPLRDNQLSPGTYALTANYPGDGNYQSSVSSAVGLTVTSSISSTAGVPQPDVCNDGDSDVTFLCALYQDVLGRSADAAGLSAYQVQLSTGTSRSTVAEELLTSTEYRGDLISSYYQQYLGRPADARGLATFLNLFSQGASEENVQAAIMGSAEFANRSEGSDNGFVTALYQDLLNRPADAAGLAAFTGQLAAGTTRSAVAEELLTSAEYRSDLINSYYQAYLGRPADGGGISTFLGQFSQGASNDAVQAELLGSAEFYTESE
jgi:trimeric autotransporter adhesin